MCIFCDIANNKIPSYKVYEDDKVLAFLDITQTSKGHTLVILKEHYDNYLELSNEDLSYLMIKVKEVSNILLDTLKPKGFNILTNVNEVAGQTVKHCHIHIIPRYDNNDDIKFIFSEDIKDSTTLENTLNEILKHES